MFFVTSLHTHLSIYPGLMEMKSSSLIGVSMEKYSIVKVLKPALFGHIYLVRHKETKKLFVMKQASVCLAREHRTSQGHCVPESIRDELRVNLAIKQSGEGKADNVVRLIDWFIHEKKSINIILEYCDEGDLYHCLVDRVQHDLSLQPGSSARINMANRYFREIVAGVGFLHELGIAHRDLSLENVMLRQDVCKVGDFGLSTLPGQVSQGKVGKDFYMAPEVYKSAVSNSIYDGKAADMWSLGVIYFMLLTGVPLYEEPSMNDMRFRLLIREGLPHLVLRLKLQHAIPPASLDILQKLLAVHPSDRLNSLDVCSF